MSGRLPDQARARGPEQVALREAGLGALVRAYAVREGRGGEGRRAGRDGRAEVTVQGVRVDRVAAIRVVLARAVEGAGAVGGQFPGVDVFDGGAGRGNGFVHPRVHLFARDDLGVLGADVGGAGLHLQAAREPELDRLAGLQAVTAGRKGEQCRQGSDGSYVCLLHRRLVLVG